MGAEAFGYGVAAVVPFLVALLFVGRDGIVNECLNAVVGKILLQLVAAFRHYREDMEDIAVPIIDFG